MGLLIDDRVFQSTFPTLRGRNNDLPAIASYCGSHHNVLNLLTS